VCSLSRGKRVGAKRSPARFGRRDTKSLRQLIERARHAAEQPLPVPFSFDGPGRELGGPDRSVHLTRSEAAIFGMLLQGEGPVPHERLAQELWGDAPVDRYGQAAFRSHIHTLRGKLRAVGLGEAIASVPGVGYRLVSTSESGATPR